MKCPKCQYLGYETGDRCKNCGYDFSFTARSAPAAADDLMLRAEPPRQVAAPTRVERREPTWPAADLDLNADALSFKTEEVSAHEPAESGLTLFEEAIESDDEPLIKVPPAPRRPVAVRRAPEIPRARPAVRVSDGEPRLQFVDLGAAPEPIVLPPRVQAQERSVQSGPCDARARVMAAGIDLAILTAIDLVVVYLTLRMASLTMSQWWMLPVVPLFLFLALVKVGYLAIFAAVGGQSIGKMAARVRVVTDEGRVLPPGLAIQRSLAALISFMTLGAAFVPALREGGRALHDRVTGTRVVALPTK
jgi:uncharacterized RDD family membrane protein YckC